MAKCCETNPVFSKTLRVLGHAELFEPVGNLLHRGPLRILRYPLWTDRTESLPRAPTYSSARQRGQFQTTVSVWKSNRGACSRIAWPSLTPKQPVSQISFRRYGDL